MVEWPGRTSGFPALTEGLLIAKILTHGEAREELADVTARAPPAVGSQELNLS
jgi:exonuclease I